MQTKPEKYGCHIFQINKFIIAWRLYKMEQDKKEYKVKSFSWVNGVLTVEKFVFGVLKEAIEFIERLVCHMVKIYDKNDTLVICRHHHHAHDTDTYA